ncbi:uncharacterized protein LOC119366074 [Triticum dicoccoides]|uniref:uncharacterized protein LOC119366074 n=1 Tax=Triticum dicoccoides TaxID=85692 RepID=UPI00188F82BA|nr:uncharacterized protein LOC119366074 [Triticum dicoccoides]
MVVHVVLLAVPAVGGFMQAFKFSVLLWPFNIMLPLLRNLPRVCLTLRAAAVHYDAELRAYLTGRRTVPLPEPGYSTLRGAQRRTREQLAAHAMIALVDISY